MVLEDTEDGQQNELFILAVENIISARALQKAEECLGFHLHFHGNK